MVSSVAYVVTYDAPTSASAGARDVLQQRSSDALDILYDTPVSGSQFGDNALSVAVLSCMQGDCSTLETRMANLLPAGTYYRVELSNGYGRFPVYESGGEPPAEAVSTTQLLEPAWSSLMLRPALSAVNPSDDPFVVYGLPIFNSNAVHADGSALRITLNATRAEDGSAYTLRSSASTRAIPDARSSEFPAVSMYFVDPDSGDPVATLDARDTTLLGGLVPSGTALPLTVRVEESAAVSIPAGSTISIHIPQGWRATASPESNPGWTISKNATDETGAYEGSEVSASLASPLQSGSIDFVFDATYVGDDNDNYVFDATLARGAYATSTLLVRADNHATTPSFEIPELLPSVPRPMGASATTTWTLGAAMPSTSGITVTRIEITEENGAAIFGGVTALTGGGAWVSEGTRLVWNGSQLVTHGSPLDLAFEVTASGVGGGERERGPFVPGVTFGAWTGRLLDEVAPGLYRGVFLPEGGSYGGYKTDTGAALYNNHSLSSATVYRSTALPGSADYTVGYVTGMHDSLFGSDVRVAQRHVPIGQTLQIEGQLQSLLYTLAPLGITPTVTMRVYPPWAGTTDTPLITEVLLDGDILGGDLLSVVDPDGDGVLDATDIGRLTTSVDVGRHWLFGAYLVEFETTWDDALSAIVGGSPLEGTLSREARVYDYFVVTPPDALNPASPIYDVRLLTWFGDWG